MRPPTPVELTEEERSSLQRMVDSPTAEQRMAFRARIVLAAAEGQSTARIAADERVRPTTVLDPT